MSEQRILVVEDEPKLAKVQLEYLHQAGFETHWIADGEQVVPWIATHPVALVILDVMLPGKSGMALCREIRALSSVPIIMATAKIEEMDRLRGLELGADDYVCKPYSHREMVARVKAILRRTGRTGDAPDGQGSRLLEIDPERMLIAIKGQPLELTPVEYRLLHRMISRPSVVFSRNKLMDDIYDDYRVVSDRTVDTHIKNLRRKIAAVMPEREVIKSVYGSGYKFEL